MKMMRRFYEELVPEAGGEGAASPGLVAGVEAPAEPSEPTSATAVDPEDNSSDFADMFDDGDIASGGEVAPEVVVAPGEGEPAAVIPTPPTEVVPSVVAPAEPAPAVTPPVETPQVSTPVEPQVDSAQIRNDYIAFLEKDMYALDEDAQALAISNPEQVLPMLAAKVHANVVDATTHGILQQLPGLVTKVLEAQMVNSQRASQFYEKWPQLVGKENEVMQIAQMYNQLNPNATLEESIQQVGLQASMSLQLPIAGYTPQAPAPAIVPVPAQVATPAPVIPITPGSGGNQVPAVATPQSNMFTDLANDFLVEDET